MWGRLLWNKILEPKIGGINMAWLAVNYHGVEVILSDRPKKLFRRLWGNDKTQIIPLPQGSIKKLIGRELKWEDEPVELKEE